MSDGGTPGIGHNSGRVNEPGKSFRRFAWAKARVALMPALPIEVVRRRVVRARELGLPYKTYAGLRAASGDDLIGFLFSSNALGVVRRDAVAPQVTADKLAGLVRTRTLAAAQAPVDPERLVPPAQASCAAPAPLTAWPQLRARLKEALSQAGMPASRTVLVCATELELEWLAAGRLAGAVRSDQYFETQPQ